MGRGTLGANLLKSPILGLLRLRNIITVMHGGEKTAPAWSTPMHSAPESREPFCRPETDDDLIRGVHRPEALGGGSVAWILVGMNVRRPGTPSSSAFVVLVL